MSDNLPILTQKQQKCESCIYSKKCYSTHTSPRNVVLNIITCRIKLGLNVNDSAKLLLSMIHPMLIKLVNNARAMVGGGYIDFDIMISDLQSHVIECLIDIGDNGYKIGGPAYLTEYLFGTNPKTGWVRKWILWQFSKHQRFTKRHVLLGNSPQSDTNDDEISYGDRHAISLSEFAAAEEVDKTIEETVKAVMAIVDDGVTLNTNEYRVISFCLSHANETNKSRLIDGTHTYLSSIMRVSRPRVTRLFAVGKRKLLSAATARDIVF